MRGTRAMLLFAAGAAASMACVSTLGPRFGGRGDAVISFSASVRLGSAALEWEPGGDVTILVDAGPVPGPSSTRIDVSGSSADISLPPGTWYVVVAPRDGGQETYSPAIELRALAVGTAGLTPLTTPSTTLVGEQATLFGVPVVGTGDVNGDGKGDVVVGASYDDVVAENSGTWFVHLGTASGLVTTPSFEASGSAAFSYCGIGMAAVGDKGIGVGADVVVGCPGEGIGNPLSTVQIHYGTATGTFTRTGGDWSIMQENQEDSTGHKVLYAGSADSIAGGDLVVARISADFGGSNTGRVSFYSGAGTSFSTTPAWSFDGGTAGAKAGLGMAAGDFDGDGRNEIAVGEPGNNGNGRVAMLEADQGASAAVLTTAYYAAAAISFGEDLAALDYDGDGIDDLAIGSRRQVSLHRGRSLAMPAGVPSWIRARPDTTTQYGFSVAGGDVNGDGYDDLLVGERAAGANDEGKVFLYLSGPNGPATTGTSWQWSSNVANGRIGENVAMIGDVNGDGGIDIAVSGSGTGLGDVPRVHVFLAPPREGPGAYLTVATSGTMTAVFGDSDVASLQPHSCSLTADGVPVQFSCAPKVEQAFSAPPGTLVRLRVTNAWGLAGEATRIAP